MVKKICMKFVLTAALACTSSLLYGQTLLYRSSVYDVFSSKVIQGKYEATAESYSKIISNYKSPYLQEVEHEALNVEWRLTKDVSAYPQYHSDQVLVDALYTKALEEMLLDVRPDGAFMAGAKWEGVWTRDISYSILLSLAILNPDRAKVSLKAKVKNQRIIQDTGTGGSWPISTDRMTWALAAWEVYLVTGDEEWLRYCYPIIKNSVEEDQQNIVNSSTGLIKGESSFLDWREQTYPRWMDPKDIFQSQTLGTNAVHCRTYQILAEMASVLGADPDPSRKTMAQIKSGINNYLWLEDKGFYGQYLYGQVYPVLSQKSESLGEALTVLFHIADEQRARKVIARTPVVNFGAPCIYPQIPNIPPYHNNAIWPFVEAYWTWASAKVGNEKSVEHGLASIYRAAALFNTNKENMVASTGDYGGTQINSDRQLWSVAGCLATIYRVFYGMAFTTKGISFEPFVPHAYIGEKSLKNFRYRNAVLTINLEGTGNIIRSVIMDGIEKKKAFLPFDLKGEHTLTLILENDPGKNSSVHLVKNKVAPETPVVRMEEKKLEWNSIAEATKYFVFRNGRKIAQRQKTSYTLPADNGYVEYQVMAVNGQGDESFLSEPLSIVPAQDVMMVDVSSSGSLLETEYKGYSKKGSLRLEKNKDQKVVFKVNVSRSGRYRIDVHYANGNGPINTDNKCAIRNVVINGASVGSIVLPQRGAANWSDWGYSSSLDREIPKGMNEFIISFTSFNNNMNDVENTALLDQLRLTLIKEN
jgi:hypothetical protein